MDNFVREAHKLKSHEKPGYTKPLPRPGLRPVLRQAGRGVSFRIGRYGWAESKKAAIDTSVRGVIYSMISCRVRRTAIFCSPRPPFLDIRIGLSGHFRSVCGHYTAMSAIARSPAPFRPARRYPVPLSRAVCLKKIAPPIG